MHARTCEAGEAIEWLAHEFGIANIDSGETSKAHQPQSGLVRSRPKQASEPRAADPELYAWLVDEAGLSSAARAYLEGRCLSPATVQHFRLRGTDDPRTLLNQALEEFG